ncbi:hypothetical protein DFH11DRAFT_1582351 [Phellopilus nigrolimitatus]|nr:hypothetical protein DFH11DRAFT_1582351 [Phellopilus nigrolimitatus]
MTKPRNCRSRILCLGLLVQLTPALRTGMCRMVVEASFAATKTTSSSSSPSEVPPHAKNVRERQQEYGLVYIMYIRFVLRAEGVSASCAVFGKAIKDKWTT